MELGAFSISLAVNDLQASWDFYGKLGFERVGGDPEQNWLILRNGGCVIGLFQGMFDTNTLTFNPGWSAEAQELPEYTDVREIQRGLRERGVELEVEVDEDGSGPGAFMLFDPDGNPILIDQHV